MGSKNFQICVGNESPTAKSWYIGCYFMHGLECLESDKLESLLEKYEDDGVIESKSKKRLMMDMKHTQMDMCLWIKRKV